MNLTLFPQDFEQGTINSSGNADSTTKIRTIGYITLDNSTNLTDITFTVTSNTALQIDIMGYDDDFNLIFDRSWYNSPYKLSISNYANLSHIRLVLKLSSNGNISVNDMVKVEIVSECTWQIDDYGYPTNVEFIDIPESPMEKPYPYALWRIEETENDGYPTNKLLNNISLLGSFANAKNLQRVSIPKSVKRIGKYAFRNTQLTSVTIAKDCEYYNTSFPDNCKIKFY